MQVFNTAILNALSAPNQGNVTFTYKSGISVPGIELKNHTIISAYYLANGTLWPRNIDSKGFYIPWDDCTLETCDLDNAFVQYHPSFGANIFFAALFILLFLIHIPLGSIYRTWGFMVAFMAGLFLEAVGSIGRAMMHNHEYTQGPFMIYICCLTIGPAFLSAGIYLCFARIISAYGHAHARFPPWVYTTLFMFSDFISLVLQGAGGGVTSTADPGTSLQDTGVNMMIAGLAFQVVSLLIFILLAVDYMVRASRGKGGPHEPAFTGLRESKWFKPGFLWAISIATVTIFVRSVYRVAELQSGFDSKLANNQTEYMILESTMVSIACIILTVFHPGVVYGKRYWKKSDFRMRGGAKTSEKDIETSTPNSESEYR